MASIHAFEFSQKLFEAEMDNSIVWGVVLVLGFCVVLVLVFFTALHFESISIVKSLL